MNRILQFIPSFTPQRSRLTMEKCQHVKDSVLPKYEISSFAEIQQNPNDIVLEIGAGYGDTITHIANQNPNVIHIACEVYIDAISSICKKIVEHNLLNIKIFADDARMLMKNIPNERLNNILLLFPDPWPKKKHHKRRIVNSSFLQEVSRVLKKDGRLFIATDDESYKIWIQEEITNQTYMKIENQTQPDWWVKTKFQKKAEDQARTTSFFILQVAKQ